MHVNCVEQIERGTLACMEACILSPDQKKKERSLKTYPLKSLHPSKLINMLDASPFYLLDLGYCQEISILQFPFAHPSVLLLHHLLSNKIDIEYLKHWHLTVR